MFLNERTCAGVLTLMIENATYRQLYMMQFCVRENRQKQVFRQTDSYRDRDITVGQTDRKIDRRLSTRIK